MTNEQSEFVAQQVIGNRLMWIRDDHYFLGCELPTRWEAFVDYCSGFSNLYVGHDEWAKNDSSCRKALSV